MDKKINIAVLVSGGGTNLQALIDAEKSGIIKDGKINLVVSNKKEVYALERAKQNNIKSEVVLRSSFASAKDFENKLIEILEKNNVELIVLAGFLAILSKEFVGKYTNRIINVHPSLIPSFCGKGFYGLKVHEEALKKGVKVTGATVHFVNEIPDGGEIIMQKAVVVKDGDTPEKLQKRVMQQAEWKLLPKAVQKVCNKMLKEK